MTSSAAVHDPATERLGQRLRRARLNRNLTQGEIAKGQFSISYISAVERGQIRPSLGALEKLANRLGVPITDLLSEGTFEARFGGATETRETYQDRHREEVESRLREAYALSRQGRPETLEQAADILLRLSSQQLTPHEQATLNWHLAYSYIELGRAEDARRAAQDGLAVAERHTELELAERLRNELGNSYSLSHSHTLALDCYRKCLQAVESGIIRDPAFALSVLYNIGNQFWFLGDYSEAIVYLLRAIDQGQDVLHPETMGAIYWSLSLSYSGRGEASEAKMYAIKSIAQFEEAGNRRHMGEVFNRLGRAYAQSGQHSDALAHLNTAFGMAQSQRDIRGMAEARRSLAALHLTQDDLQAAELAAAEALEHAEATEDALQRAESLMMVADVQARQNKLAEAESSYSQAIELLRTVQSPEHLRDALARFSTFLESRGESKRALDMLKEAYKVVAQGVSAF